jgi:hypothetical protein
LRWARRTRPGVSLVDLTIAIVVFAVASFGRWHTRRARDASTAARVRPFTAFADLASRRASSTSARVTIIDGAVAIVVFVVAKFARGLNRLRTNERSARTRECALRAETLLTGHETLATTTGIAFVDRTIAVIVDTVAVFCTREDRLIARDHATQTDRRSCIANTRLTRGACLTAARITFVGDSITIVVEAIALFGRRLHR